MLCIVTWHLADRVINSWSPRSSCAPVRSNKIRSWITIRRSRGKKKEVLRRGSVVFAVMFARARARLARRGSPYFHEIRETSCRSRVTSLQRRLIAATALSDSTSAVCTEIETFSHIRGSTSSIARLNKQRESTPIRLTDGCSLDVEKEI